jgi:AcrR family transcriptional regulator
VTEGTRVGDPATREKLLQATILIAAERGLGAVTYRSVAAKAGVAHGLVRFYFGSRQAMLLEAFEHAADEDARETDLTADDIDGFGAELTRTISEHSARGILQYDYLLSAVRGAAPRERVAARYDEYIARVGQTLRNAAITDQDGSLAAVVFAALDGIVLQYAIYDDTDRMDRALEHVRDVLRLLQERDARGRQAMDSATDPRFAH